MWVPGLAMRILSLQAHLTHCRPGHTAIICPLQKPPYGAVFVMSFCCTMIPIMLRQIAFTLVIAALPLNALGDSSALQVTGGSGASTDNTGSVLQPASPNNLQASGSDQANGLAAPANSNLQQAPANSSAVTSYLNGELVGGQQAGKSEPVKANSSVWQNLLATLIMVVILGVIFTMWRRQRPALAAPAVEPAPVKPKAHKAKHKSKKTRKH